MSLVLCAYIRTCNYLKGVQFFWSFMAIVAWLLSGHMNLFKLYLCNYCFIVVQTANSVNLIIILNMEEKICV